MMIPNNINSIVISGSDLEYILFKCAFHYAEQGLHVWIISPKSFDKLPKKVATPDKDVLKVITFLYLEDYKDLINHINDIHTWRKLPNVLILNSFEHYSCLTSNSDNTKPAFIASLLLDAVNVCSCKNSKPSLLLACLNFEDHVLDEKLKSLLHLYFEHVMKLQEEENSAVDSIIRLANLINNVQIVDSR